MKPVSTQKELAERLGLPRTTVAAALNQRLAHKIGLEIRERIRQAANEFGYVPNQAARNLSRGQTREIVFAINASLSNPHIHVLVEEVHARLTAQGYRLGLELCPSSKDKATMFRTFEKGRCDGVVLEGVDLDENHLLQSLQNRGMPVVVTNPVPGLNADTVSYDRVESARIGTAHLLQRGHKHVALLVHNRGIWFDDMRSEGYRRALAEGGVPFDDSRIVLCGADPDMRAVWSRIRNLSPRPTGIVCCNVEMMAQLLGVMRRDGVRVPDQIALVTLGDAPLNTMVETPLTAVDSNFHEMAAAIVKRLLGRMAYPAAPPQHILVKPVLVVRESTGSRRCLPCPSADG
jgi:LacI family transcriptional regulator